MIIIDSIEDAIIARRSSSPLPGPVQWTVDWTVQHMSKSANRNSNDT